MKKVSSGPVNCSFLLPFFLFLFSALRIEADFLLNQHKNDFSFDQTKELTKDEQRKGEKLLSLAGFVVLVGNCLFCGRIVSSLS